jgi:thioredoxin 1
MGAGSGLALTVRGTDPTFPRHERFGPRGQARETRMAMPTVSDKTFDLEVLQSAEPVLVDFFAEWCGPCKAMAPALEQVAHEMKGKVKVVKLDVDQNPTVTGKYGIRAMPTLLLFKNGKVAAQHVGALVQKRRLEEWINGSIMA